MLRHYLNLPRPVYLLCLGTFINRAGTFIIPFLTIYMRDVLEASDAFAPVAMGVFGLGSICGAILGGQLADRIGRRAVMLGALFGGGAMLLLIGQLDDASAFIVGVFVFATVGETYRPAAMAMVGDLTTPTERTHAFALQYIAINLGFAIGPAAGGMIAEYSYKWLFFGDAATCWLYALIILFGIRETLRRPHAVDPAQPTIQPETARPLQPPVDNAPDDALDRMGEATELQVAAISNAPAATPVAPTTTTDAIGAGPTGVRAVAGYMLRDTTFVALCGATFLIALLYMQGMSTFPLYLDALGFGTAQYGRIIAVNGLLIVICQLPLTNWMHDKPRGLLLVGAALLTAMGFALKAVAFSEATFMATVVIWTLGEMMQAPLLPPIITELAPDSMRARYMGVFGMCFSGASTIGAPLGGLALKYAGPSVLWLGGASLAVIAATLYAAVRRDIAHPDSARPDSAHPSDTAPSV